ncbi:Retrovirus-related Pol polyprotein from transposon TNT 1-94 [Dendrobium catenatum]|uniref:Retrovirus-related Pol polyprotein from transposon TNT 1-94 n=1 Tax=Dendrobium catenatum TaxID=906689 RepID=A0A2I0WQX0_9ASPA|nr:Retrovirus-related Pol polyprotein from transposon TNT 1-94 [Dendrobium catenatum]
MKDRTMQQYLTQIKTLIDHIAAAGSTVDSEDIILCILNGLPSTLIKTHFQGSIQKFRSDGGGEFVNNTFKSYLLQHGIEHQLSCPYTPEQNGLVERKHCHLLDLTRTFLHASYLPNSFWVEAVSKANYLINRLPSSAIKNQTP